MKKLLLSFAMVGSVYSCSNEVNTTESEKNPNENMTMKSSMDDFNVGQMHNDILEIYYADNDYDSDSLAIMEKQLMNI